MKIKPDSEKCVLSVRSAIASFTDIGEVRPVCTPTERRRRVRRMGIEIKIYPNHVNEFQLQKAGPDQAHNVPAADHAYLITKSSVHSYAIRI